MLCFFPLFNYTKNERGTLLANYETDASQLKESVTVTYSFVQLFMLTTAGHLVTLSCVLDPVLSASQSPYVFSVIITTPEVKVKVLVS